MKAAETSQPLFYGVPSNILGNCKKTLAQFYERVFYVQLVAVLILHIDNLRNQEIFHSVFAICSAKS